MAAVKYWKCRGSGSGIDTMDTAVLGNGNYHAWWAAPACCRYTWTTRVHTILAAIVPSHDGTSHLAGKSTEIQNSNFHGAKFKFPRRFPPPSDSLAIKAGFLCASTIKYQYHFVQFVDPYNICNKAIIFLKAVININNWVILFYF